jgi:hypothetical protein
LFDDPTKRGDIMKRYRYFVIVVVLYVVILPVTILPQVKQKTMNINPNQMQIMEMMRDSSSVNMLMDRMVSDDGMRAKLMDKIINRVHRDSSAVMQICKTIKGDKEMHTMMMKMMDKKDGEGMMEKK